MNYSVLILKITRKNKIVKSGLTLSEAIVKAEALYEAGVLFHSHATLTSGVAVLVVEETQGWEEQPLNHVKYQCGGF